MPHESHTARGASLVRLRRMDPCRDANRVKSAAARVTGLAIRHRNHRRIRSLPCHFHGEEVCEDVPIRRVVEYPHDARLTASEVKAKALQHTCDSCSPPEP